MPTVKSSWFMYASTPSDAILETSPMYPQDDSDKRPEQPQGNRATGWFTQAESLTCGSLRWAHSWRAYPLRHSSGNAGFGLHPCLRIILSL